MGSFNPTQISQISQILSLLMSTFSVLSVGSVCLYPRPTSHPPKQVFSPLVIPFGHVREKRGIEGVRRIEGVFLRVSILIKYLHLPLRLLRQHKG